MKRLVPFLLASVLLATTLPAPEVSLRYAPSEGTTLTRAFAVVSNLELEEFRSSMNGQEVPSEYLPHMELSVDQELRVAVTDELHSVGEGRPLILERIFDELEFEAHEEFFMEPGGVSSSGSGEGTSPLEGRTVRFEWNAEEGGYEVAFEDGQEAPADLEEDLDLRALLPSGEVGQGASWTVDIDEAPALFGPGGDLGWDWETTGEMQGDYLAERDVDGELVLTFDGLEDEGRLARVEITAELERVEVAAGDLENVPVAQGTATTTTTTVLDLRGRMLWDLEAGRLDSIELVADMDTVIFTEKDPDQPGGTFSSTLVLAGSWSCEASVRTP